MKDVSVSLSASAGKISKADIVLAVINHLLAAVCSVLLCRTVFMGKYLPFGVALTAGCSTVYLPSIATGVFIGYFIPAINASGFRYIAAMLAVTAVRFMLTGYKKLSEKPLFSALISVTALGMSSAVTFSGINADVLLLSVECVICGAAAIVFGRTSQLLKKLENGLSPEELGCLIISASLLLGGMDSIYVLGISLSHILAVAVMLSALKYGGALAGTVSAISIGAVLYFSSQNAAECFVYAICAVIAGLVVSYGKYVMISAFFACGVVCAVSGGFAEQTALFIVELLLGCLIFALLPRSAGLYLGKILTCFPQISVNNDLNRAVTLRLKSASSGLKDVKSTVDDVATRLEEINAPDFSSVINKIQIEACAGCKLRMHCWEAKKQNTLDAIFIFIKHIKSEGSAGEKDFPDEFKGRCIRTDNISAVISRNYSRYSYLISARGRIQQIRQAVTDQFDGISVMLGEMAQEFSSDMRFDNSAALTAVTALKNIGICADECSAPIDKYGRMKIEMKLIKSNDTVLNKRDIMKVLSLSCERDFSPPVIHKASGETFITATERAVFKADIGVSQKSAREGDMCGDAYCSFYDGKGHFVMLLSDGMGTGGRAAVDSAMATGLMSRLIKSGFGYDCALKILNSSMLFKSADESLATMDIASIDMYNGNTELFKAGAAPTVVRRLGRSGKAVSTSMPVGILSDVSFDKAGIKLHSGDILVLLSDGAVTDGTDWIRDEIERFKDGSAKDLADRICEYAYRRRDDGHTDDITVMVSILNKTA